MVRNRFFLSVQVLFCLGTLGSVLAEEYSSLQSPCADYADEQEWNACWERYGSNPVPIDSNGNSESVIMLGDDYEIRYRGFSNCQKPATDAVECHLGSYTAKPSIRWQGEGRKVDIYLNGEPVPDKYFHLNALNDGWVNNFIDWYSNGVLRIYLM